LSITKFSRRRRDAAAATQTKLRKYSRALLSLMISTARMLPVGSSATSPLRRRKTHQLVQNPESSIRATMPISNAVPGCAGRSVSHFRAAATERPPVVNGEGVSSTSGVTTPGIVPNRNPRREIGLIASAQPITMPIVIAGTRRPSEALTQAARSTAAATAQPMTIARPSRSPVSRSAKAATTRARRKNRNVSRPSS
jgi:hypothetical protein